MRDNRRASSVAASQKQAATQLTPQQCVDLSARNTRHGLENVKADLIASRIEALKSDLPHLHGLKMYTWQRRFFESRNKMNLLCAANQIGKSTIAIRKNIEWAGNPELWPDLWKTSPKIFWYFYPSNEVATVEFEKKWVPDYLPRGTMKAHRTYGWNVEYSNGTLNAVHFNSGVSIFFKSYGQKIVNLQTATVHMITSDEEMPESYVDEILSRLRGTGGYFNQVFTATCGYPLWYRAMECIGGPEEAFRTAFKQVISLYDCKVYEDGTPSSWTDARIAEAEASCTSKREVLKRIHGRFVKDEGLRYEAFDYDRNVTPAVEIPRDWKFYTGVDIGSGGRGRSSGAIIFLAVSPDFSRARVIRSWRGDNVETTASDILAKYRAMRGKLPISRAAYDYASREFGLIASRLGESFERADKTKSSGEATVNTLLKSGALTIDMQVDDNPKLVTELMSIPGGVEKNRKFQDDLADALKYAIALIPWNFTKIQCEALGISEDSLTQEEVVPQAEWTEAQYQAWELRQRRGEMEPTNKEGWTDYEDEISEWNSLYGSAN